VKNVILEAKHIPEESQHGAGDRHAIDLLHASHHLKEHA
jgi:hypothetical protein